MEKSLEVKMWSNRLKNDEGHSAVTDFGCVREPYGLSSNFRGGGVWSHRWGN